MTSTSAKAPHQRSAHRHEPEMTPWLWQVRALASLKLAPAWVRQQLFCFGESAAARAQPLSLSFGATKLIRLQQQLASTSCQRLKVAAAAKKDMHISQRQNCWSGAY